MATELVLRFGYGAIVPWVTRLDDGTLRAIAGPEMVLLRTPVHLVGHNMKTVAEFTVAAGEVVPFILSNAPSHLAPPAPPDPERGKLEAELRTERDARVRLAEQLARLTQPQVNTAIFSLGLVRGGESPANRIALRRDPEWIVLAVELPAEEAPAYRATLATAAGRTVWKGEGLKAGADGTVAIALYSTLLAPGSYKLRLEAVDAKGHGAPAGEIPLQVTR